MIDDKLQEVNMTVEDPKIGYFWDSYALWETKEQIQIGNEVEAPKSETITINTSDSIEKTERTYTLTVPSLTGWKIFSIGIDGMEKTFQESTYAWLETSLQTWLWENYTVSYVSGTTFNISKYDWSVITKNSPNLVRTIQLSNFTSISRIDVIVDWVTVVLDWPTHAWDEATAITYLMSQLSTSTYYMDDVWDTLIIARKDGAIPVITKTQYNRYTYSVGFKYADTPLSWQYHTSTTFGIDWTTYNFTVWDWLNTRIVSNGRPFNGDLIIKYFEWKLSEKNTWFNFWSTFDPSSIAWTKITIHKNCKITTVQVAWSHTTAYIKNNAGTTLATATITWRLATFNYDITPWTYRIEATWDSYRYDYGTLSKSNEFFTAFATGSYNWSDSPFWDIHNITYINIEWVVLSNSTYNYTFSYSKSSGWSDTVWIVWNRSLYFWQNHTIRINKPDYSAMTFVQTSTWDNWMAPSLYTLLFENDNKADITIATYTEITITLSASWNNYFIPVWFNPVKIEITAESSVWRSTWIWEWWAKRWAQSCNSSVSWIVADKVFQTNASNYGSVLVTKRWWFTMSWTTNTANKLLIKCS